ncbi:MAG: hypothetical protein EOP92_27865 [Lysobacteraceae bacterium]|nr:MAG: hypothetical protein EOP92_27865 [Xanthomonadaceae bacterium]
MKQTCLTRMRSAAGRLLPGRRLRALRCWRDAGTFRPDDTGVARNRLDDALKFDAHGATLTYWQFLRVATERMERSNDLYSLVRDGKLLVFCWMAIGGAAMIPQELQLLATQPGSAVFLFGLYMHPEMAKNEHLRSFLQHILCELQRRAPGRQLYLQCRLDQELEQVFRESGFEDALGTPPGLPQWVSGAAAPAQAGPAPEQDRS